MPPTPDAFSDVLAGYGRQHPPALPLPDDGDLAAWQARFRAALLPLRGPVPERVPLDVEIEGTVEDEEHTRQRIRIAVSQVVSTPANLLVPRGIAAGERRPGLVVYHGHESDMDRICGVRPADDASEDFDARAYALHAVRAGFVVVALPLWGWAGRDGHVDRVGTRDKCNVIQMASSFYGLNPLALHLQDGEAALDLLASRPDVDGARLACLGNSTGGRSTMWLAALDPRVRACVPSGCMNTFRERSLKLSSCGIQCFPGLLQIGDVPEVFGLIAPRAVQLQAGQGDGLITPADRDDMERRLRAAWGRAGCADRFDYLLHPHGHRLEWAPAAAFLQRHLT